MTHTRGLRPAAALGLLAFGLSAQAADSAPAPGGVGVRPSARQDETALLLDRLARQNERIDALQRALAAQQARVDALLRRLPDDGLEVLRGARDGGPPTASVAPVVQSSAIAPLAQASGSPQPPAATTGQAPAQTPGSRAPVAQVFDQPGVLTPRGRLIVEPALSYSYSSTNRVSVVGYTVIPAINIGLFDIREVKRNTWTGTLTARWGLSNRTEVEARLPYVYRHDDTISRPFGTGTGNDQLLGASGQDVGDIEFAVRHQLNQPPAGRPYYIGSLRFKTRTGRDPFEVLTDPSLPVGTSAGTPGLQRELPTGSGFYALQPALTWLFPSDPAVFFGSVSYLYNFERSGLSTSTTNGPQLVGSLRPGGIFGFNFGMGLALNDRASLSLGYDHASVGRTQQNGSTLPLSVRTQLGTLLMGFAYKLDARRNLNVSLGVGVTRDAPDLTLTVRVPYSL